MALLILKIFFITVGVVVVVGAVLAIAFVLWIYAQGAQGKNPFQ